MTLPKTDASQQAPKPARKPRTKKVVEATEEAPKHYIRNRGLVRVRIAPPRKKGDEFHYNLAPRGERGDAEPVDESDMHYLTQANENQGLYELISEEEAHSYMVKQTTNQQHYHPALAALKDQYGNPIRGIAHESTPQSTVLSNVVVPEGDLNRLNQMPPGKPQE